MLELTQYSRGSSEWGSYLDLESQGEVSFLCYSRSVEHTAMLKARRQNGVLRSAECGS